MTCAVLRLKSEAQIYTRFLWNKIEEVLRFGIHFSGTYRWFWKSSKWYFCHSLYSLQMLFLVSCPFLSNQKRNLAATTELDLTGGWKLISTLVIDKCKNVTKQGKFSLSSPSKHILRCRLYENDSIMEISATWFTKFDLSERQKQTGASKVQVYNVHSFSWFRRQSYGS